VPSAHCGTSASVELGVLFLANSSMADAAVTGVHRRMRGADSTALAVEQSGRGMVGLGNDSCAKTSMLAQQNTSRFVIA
jgi:hypothetical protein